MPPDDSNKNIFSLLSTPTDPLNPVVPPADQPVQNQNVWGQSAPQVPVLESSQPLVVQPDPNKNIWGQPIEVPTPVLPVEELQVPPQQQQIVQLVQPVLPAETQPQIQVDVPIEEKISSPPAVLEVTPTFNPYDVPPAVVGVPKPATGAPLENPILAVDIPETPKKGFPKVILLVIALIVFVVLAVFGVKALLGSKAKKTENAAKQTEITWWGLWEEERVIKPLIDEYQAKNPKVKINYIKNSQQDYRERLANALAKGTGPDIFYFHNTWVPMFSKELDAVPTSVMSTTDFTKNYFSVITLDASRGTGFVGIPLGYDALTLYINEDIFKQESLDPPKTWVEVRDVAKKLTKIENGQIVRSGVALGRTENVDHWQDIVGLMFVQNRVNLKKPEGKKAEDALKFFSIFSAVDKVWDETLPSSTQAFATGKLAMYFGPSWRALTIKELNPNLKFKTVPLPQLPKEDPNEQDISYATYWLNGVWTRSKNKDLAWDFMKFISSKESLEKMYQLAANSRGFGECYPRLDMKDMLVSSDILGSIATLAPNAKSWYLASRTFDGTTGINSQISKYFEDAINAINQGVQPTKAMESLTPGVVQVLQQYGLTK